MPENASGGSSSSSSLLIRSKNPRRCQAENPLKLLSEFAGPALDAASYQRIEVITGERRRRSWSDAEKARIVAESADPETSISEVARRNGVNRGLLSVWRRQARLASSEAPQFVQVRLQAAVEAQPNAIDKAHVLTDPAERIEVMIAGATVRVPVGVDAATLERVLAAVRSTR
ncbi:IS66-like element accessory protein TnpA [Bradyrhizobium sp. USDA 241]|uniref:IS66-like element accessory protein TnpA n=1 Tax=Bradyrhizobium sp. USDA 241 TaxID=3377725 RepID=UPI003C73FBC0